MAKKIALLISIIMIFSVSVVFASEISDDKMEITSTVEDSSEVETTGEENDEPLLISPAPEDTTAEEQTVISPAPEATEDTTSTSQGDSTLIGAIIAIVIVVAVVAIVAVIQKK